MFNPVSAISPALVERFDRPGPRYTSYPTADRFVAAYDCAAHAAWLTKRNIGGFARPLSLYLHIPFCANLCYYCACNKIITKDHGRSAKYLHYLEKEMDLVAGLLGDERSVSQLHLGGGSPTFLSSEELTRLMEGLRRHFDLSPGGEYSVEIDPRTVQADTFAHLAGLGFNRISLGVQDFDPRVQEAIHRVQPAGLTRAALESARANGVKSVNFDLIYGLPRQTLQTCSETLDEVIDCRPDRIALYSYAHLPARFKPQRRINQADLPTPEEKVAIFVQAAQRLELAGYVHIGLDHFALPEDELARALLSGQLHRNFQGYTTQADCDLLGMGISAISKVGPTYCQNAYTLNEYYDALDQHRLPVARGIELTRDDLVRRAVIMGLMCQGELSLESIEIGYLIDFADYFSRELAELGEFADGGLLEIDDEWISVTPLGRYFLRGICLPFDRHLRSDRERQRFSRLI